MKPIPISTCEGCKPDNWLVVGPSKGEYKCEKCKRISTKILRRKKTWKIS